ncbi:MULTISPECIES: retropepsin-like aspartic protease family protein [Cohaesibacter]|uniref:retropepsin-like aspartic protease family protein n=1 Tax=Cohaesibacter TaxID=655352 RepID=UPI000DE84194|nr:MULTISPECIES: TIGR02281 family clan AA aspartic protease [Cohaesibacter]TLP43334.1 TIGR02281 family clan AA aspartic protease [Cohaesibacter sp. CAU 1516]
MFYVLLGIIATAVALLMFNHDQGQLFGYPLEMVASITLTGSLLLYLLSGGRTRRSGLFENLKQAAIWLLIGFALVLGYSFKDDAKMLVERVKGELIPGVAMVSEGGDVTFRRTDNGHFRVLALVNGASLPMIVDTGASAVVLTYEDAEKAGIPISELQFSSPVNTANGQTHAARIWLNNISIGGISEARVPAMVAQKGDLFQSLLGMTYLDRLSGWSVQGDRLTMRP